jgi:hypothetical protein
VDDRPIYEYQATILNFLSAALREGLLFFSASNNDFVRKS